MKTRVLLVALLAHAAPALAQRLSDPATVWETATVRWWLMRS